LYSINFVDDRSMNILITGAAGFIGFHLSLHLNARKDRVFGLDNFNPYYDIKLKLTREKILLEKGIKIIHADIRDKETLKELIVKNQITHIIHLAAQAGVRNSLIHPDDYIASNLEGFISLLECCIGPPKIKVIYASSSSVYGKNKKVPFSTDDPTDTPTNLYGATKKANELIAHSYHHLYNIPLIGLRYFTAYGPWGRPDMAYFKFTECIINDKPFEVYGYGNMRRDFTYIDDIVSGTIAALDSDITFDIFNLGNSHPIKILDFISLLERLLKKKAITRLLPIQKGEVIETFADISKSQKFLNFQPQVPLEEGLSKFIEWYKEYKTSMKNYTDRV
jgi:UDP-glucuronate 4-epimerase